MATREDYRLALDHKLLALEDGSYGDFEYSVLEKDTYIDLAVARLFPAVYRTASALGLTLTAYGTNLLGYAADDSVQYERVFMVEDAVELQQVVGWELRPTRIVGIDTNMVTTINVYWTEAFTMPESESAATGIPTVFEPLVNLGALIEALEARQDTGVRGEPQPTGQFQETQLLDRLRPRYDSLKADLAMSLPGMRF